MLKELLGDIVDPSYLAWIYNVIRGKKVMMLPFFLRIRNYVAKGVMSSVFDFSGHVACLSGYGLTNSFGAGTPK